MISILLIFSCFLQVHIWSCSTHKPSCYFSMINTPIWLRKFQENIISMYLIAIINIMLKVFINFTFFILVYDFIPLLNVKIILISTKLTDEALHFMIGITLLQLYLLFLSLIICGIFITIKENWNASLLFVYLTYASKSVILNKVLLMSLHF